MGLMNGLLGNASKVDAEKANRDYAKILGKAVKIWEVQGLLAEYVGH